MPADRSTITPQMLAVGDALREAREKQALTQAALADRAGVAQGTLAGWERGHRAPSLVQVHGLASALGISAASLAKKIFEKIA